MLSPWKELFRANGSGGRALQRKKADDHLVKGVEGGKERAAKEAEVQPLHQKRGGQT